MLRCKPTQYIPWVKNSIRTLAKIEFVLNDFQLSFMRHHTNSVSLNSSCLIPDPKSVLFINLILIVG